MFLRQSTSQAVRFGPFLDSADAVTPETALTIAQADMQLSKNGAAFAQKNAAGNATHDTDGWYSTTLDTTDTGTVGELLLQVNVTGAGPVWVRWYVVEEAVYDALYAASAAGYNATTPPTVAAIRTEMDNNSTKLAAIESYTQEVQLDWTDGGRLDLILAAVFEDTNEMQGDWANGGRLDNILDARASQASVDTIDAIVDQILADTGTDGVVLAAAQMNAVADHLLRRSLASARASSNGDTVGFRSLLGMVAKQVNRVGVSGANLVTYEEDDATTFGTQAITTDPAAEPITQLDTT